MTKEEFRTALTKMYGKVIANEVVNDLCYETNGQWDEELAQQWYDDLLEEYRFGESVDSYRDCGY